MTVQAKRWRSAKVIEAADIPAKDLSRFLDRNIIPREAADIDPGGSGRPRLFGARTIYRTAITYRLVGSGLAPATARRLASKFCDESQPGRQPGALFPTGKTILIATPDGDGKILNLAAESFLDEALHSEVSLVVDIGKVVEGVNVRLGLAVSTGGNVDVILSEFSNPILKANHDDNI
jgi:hypothetical protein